MKPNESMTSDLIPNQALKVLVKRPNKSFSATKFLLIDPTGGDIYIKLEGNNAVFVYETPSEKRIRLAYQERLLTSEMVLIRGGTFTMGCTPEQEGECDDDELPAHEVTISDFHIGKYEVMQEQWQAVMGNNPSRFSGCGQCPVESVSWDDIQQFLI